MRSAPVFGACLGEFRSRALFIVDEAHRAAPSGGARYAISSQLTRAVRELSERPFWIASLADKAGPTALKQYRLIVRFFDFVWLGL
jgi:hypothetical protein